MDDFSAPDITERQAAEALKAEGFRGPHRVWSGNTTERLWARGADDTAVVGTLWEKEKPTTGKLRLV